MAQMGDRLWYGSESFRNGSNLAGFMDWLAERGQRFEDYEALRQWSVADVPGFWQAIWDYFGIESSTPYTRVLSGPEMPGAKWFEGAHVNYARRLLAAGEGDRTAIHAAGEAAPLRTLSWDELRSAVHRVATSLRELGVEPGDRVAAYVPNVPEAAIAFLACASIGAVWSSCSPDFGAPSVVDRFRQIEPKLLIATDGYTYGGKAFDRREQVRKMVAELPSVQHVVHLPGLAGAEAPVENALPWSRLIEREAVRGFEYEDTAFDHPLWIVYSSGTTGPPKPFVHGHGGILLEALKFMHFHTDLKPDSTMFFFTTTGWIMWNILINGLVTGSAIVMYDGNPLAPEPDVLWKLAADTGATLFGASPAYVNFQMRQGIVPRERYDVSRIRSMLVSGSPVMPEHMEWCLENVHDDIWLTSQSGGTDVASAFVGGSPLLPVYAGEIQTRCLGVDVHALNDDGEPVIDEVGELVVRQPMPSMPLYFWGDENFARYKDSYFDVYPGQWRHGDYLKINERGGCFIMGRSDSTLNRHGVRIGTAEIYSVVEALDEVEDSIVVNLDLPGGHSFMPLFVVTAEGRELDDDLADRIRAAIREAYSPRHVPDRIYSVPKVPTTLTGKKMEVPVRKILLGQAADKVASRDAMANPAALDYFVEYARTQRDYEANAA